jgi:hypothetical protein
MSLAIEPLETVNVLEPRVKFNEKRRYAILKGGLISTWKPNISTSYSNSSIQHTAPPPNPAICVDRKVMSKVPLNISASGTVTSPQVTLFDLAGGKDSLRQFPLAQIVNVLNVTLNNTAVSINMNDVIQPLVRYNTDVDDRQFNYSMSPAMADQYQNYSDGVGTARNPLAPYGDNSAEMSRGAFPVEVVLNDASNCIVNAVVTEYLHLSPFLFTKHNKCAFIGLQTMDFNFTLDSNLARVWSHVSTNSNLSSINVSIGGAPQLLFNYITPQQLVPIPRSVVYPYFITDRYPVAGNVNVAANAAFTMTSNNIQLNSIPNRIYIFARRRNQDRTYLTSDVYATLDSITVNWNNNSGLLSAATAQDLYKMSAENGCDISWPQWHKPQQTATPLENGVINGGFVGSVLCIEFGKDICLPDMQCPGMLGTYQLQYTANFRNPSSQGVNYDLYTVVISEGTFTVMDNRSVAQIGVMSKEDVLNAKSNDFVDFETVQKYYGGDFFGSIGDFFSGAYNKTKGAVEAAVPLIQKGIEIGKTVGPYVAPLLAAAGKKKAGSVVGGKMLSRSDLKKRIEDIEHM